MPPAAGRGVGRRSVLRLGAVAAAGAAELLTAACGPDAPNEPTGPSTRGPGGTGASSTPNANASGGASATEPMPASGRQPLLTPAGSPPSALRPTWAELFQRGHGWQAAGEGTASADLNDTSIVLTGSQAVRVTTAGTGSDSMVRATGLAPVDLTGKMLRLTFRVDDVAHLDRLAFQIGTGSLADGFSWDFHVHSAKTTNYVQSGEWVVVHLQWADVTSAAGVHSLNAAGTPSATSGFTAMALHAHDDARGPITYRLQSVEALPDTRTFFPRGVVSITFDDSYASVHGLAAPTLREHGFVGTVYNIAEAANTAGRLSTTQMRGLQDDDGWEMAGHAYATAAHNVGYSALTSAQVRDDMARLRGWLDANAFPSPHFAYPHGAFGRTLDGEDVDRIAAEHFATARSIVFDTAESFIPAMPYRLKALTGLTDGTGIGGTPPTAVTAAGARLDRCATAGDWLILCFHDVSAGAPTSSSEIRAGAFGEVLRAIADQGIPVMTVGDVMRHYA
jgi:peptidoglycan/xylan/chitin deacetylase (PgdA/CDA1 family)